MKTRILFVFIYELVCTPPCNTTSTYTVIKGLHSVTQASVTQALLETRGLLEQLTQDIQGVTRCLCRKSNQTWLINTAKQQKKSSPLPSRCML